MKICIAQLQPVKGDVGKNIELHEKLINIAVSLSADVIVFPELSLTGYEPTLAQELAATPDDKRFDIFQKISNEKRITIGVGMPITTPFGITISMICFRSDKPRQVYSKKYIHADEEGFFVSGQNPDAPIFSTSNIALAICYEISVPAHAEDAFNKGAKIYIASVAKSTKGIDAAIQRLSDIARSYSMIVFMSNCTGLADGVICAGKSSIWNASGELIGQLDNTSEGLLMLDTESMTIDKRIVIEHNATI